MVYGLFTSQPLSIFRVTIVPKLFKYYHYFITNWPLYPYLISASATLVLDSNQPLLRIRHWSTSLYILTEHRHLGSSAVLRVFWAIFYLRCLQVLKLAWSYMHLSDLKVATSYVRVLMTINFNSFSPIQFYWFILIKSISIYSNDSDPSHVEPRLYF